MSMDLINDFKPLVIASVYKGTKKNELEDFFDSIRCQSCKSFDVAICIDGSCSEAVKKSLKNFSKYLNKFCKFITLENSQNLGLAKSLNRLIVYGLEHGYTLFIRADTDDTFPPERIALLLQAKLNNPHIDVIGSSYSYFGIKNGICLMPRTHDQILHKYSYDLPIAHASVMFDKSFFEKAGLYQSGYKDRIEDQRLWLSGFRSECQFLNLQEVLYNVRTSESILVRRNSIKEKILIFSMKFSHIIENNFSMSIKIVYSIRLLTNTLTKLCASILFKNNLFINIFSSILKRV